ncbi:MAG: hypothetical protein EOP04_04070 [Proteobacteria bacterium]|nr:MAG: hypothetical protein EOP04_04070 [Pseudomonadota bacterium]
MKNDHKIMNWGIEIGRNRTKLSGELIDQTDRAESQNLGDALNLNDRTIEVYKLQNEVSKKVDSMIMGLGEQTVKENNANVNPANVRELFKNQTDAAVEQLKALHEGLGKVAGMGS